MVKRIYIIRGKVRREKIIIKNGKKCTENKKERKKKEREILAEPTQAL